MIDKLTPKRNIKEKLKEDIHYKFYLIKKHRMHYLFNRRKYPEPRISCRQTE